MMAHLPIPGPAQGQPEQPAFRITAAKLEAEASTAQLVAQQAKSADVVPSQSQHYQNKDLIDAAFTASTIAVE